MRYWLFLILFPPRTKFVVSAEFHCVFLCRPFHQSVSCPLMRRNTSVRNDVTNRLHCGRNQTPQHRSYSILVSLPGHTISGRSKLTSRRNIGNTLSIGRCLFPLTTLRLKLILLCNFHYIYDCFILNPFQNSTTLKPRFKTTPKLRPLHY